MLTADALALDYQALIHFAPTVEQRRTFAKSGVAMPDGSFFIRNATDLSNAIRAVGRATPNAGESDVARRNAVRRHIIVRATALKLTNMIPDTWNSDGTLKQSGLADEVEEFLTHYGILGMKWGVRRSHLGTSSSRPRVSGDASRARDLQSQVRRHGTRSLSNQELQQLVTRMNLERQYSNLNQKHVSTGRKIVNDIAGIGTDIAKQQAISFANKYASQGIDVLIKKASKK